MVTEYYVWLIITIIYFVAFGIAGIVLVIRKRKEGRRGGQVELLALSKSRD